jgi:hypothetical protein
MALPDFLQNYSNEELEQVVSSGSIASTFDEYGVLRLDYDESKINNSTISIPLISDVYDTDAVEERFDAAFTEFEINIPTQIEE